MCKCNSWKYFALFEFLFSNKNAPMQPDDNLLQNAELCMSSDSSQDNFGSDGSQGLIVFCLAGETNLDVISAATYLQMSFPVALVLHLYFDLLFHGLTNYLLFLISDNYLFKEMH